MLRKLRKKIRQKRGSAFLECTAIIPLWILIMFSTLDLASYANARWDCMNISRAVVRYGSLQDVAGGKGLKAQQGMFNLERAMIQKYTKKHSAITLMPPTNIYGTNEKGTRVLAGREGVGAPIYANTCASVNMYMTQIWGKKPVEVCSDYLMIRTREGEK